MYEQLKKYVRSTLHDNQAKKGPKKTIKRESEQLKRQTTMGDSIRQGLTDSKLKNESMKPIKYTYIIYPNSMKTPAYVDLLEQQLNADNPKQPVSDSQLDLKQDSVDGNEDKASQSPNKSMLSSSVSKLKLRREATSRSKSRNQSVNKGGALKKMQKLANFEKY